MLIFNFKNCDVDDLYIILRKIRVDNNLTQANVADDLGISLTGYAKIERGETDVNYSRIKQIAAYYNLDLVQLLTYNERGKSSDFDLVSLSSIADSIKKLEKRIDELDVIVKRKIK